MLVLSPLFPFPFSFPIICFPGYGAGHDGMVWYLLWNCMSSERKR